MSEPKQCVAPAPSGFLPSALPCWGTQACCALAFQPFACSPHYQTPLFLPRVHGEPDHLRATLLLVLKDDPQACLPPGLSMAPSDSGRVTAAHVVRNGRRQAILWSTIETWDIQGTEQPQKSGGGGWGGEKDLLWGTSHSLRKQ